jgi:putative tryptophan/tyrosine transport system substrate-binding protein
MKHRVLALNITLLLLATPLAAEAQQAAKGHVIGLLTPRFDELGLSFRLPGWLEELGYREGKNVRYEKRTADGGNDRLPDLAAELARLLVDVIVTSGSLATRAAQRATARVPIVMAVGDDPVAAGLVHTLARPGENVTGLTTLGAALSGKRLELLKQAVPRATRVCVLWNPANPDKTEELKQARDAANTLGLDLQSVEVRTPDELPTAFDAVRKTKCDALLVLSDNVFWTSRSTLTELAARYRLPAMYPDSIFVDFSYVNGLMSYEPGQVETIRAVAGYVDRVLKGAQPSSLPIEQTSRFNFIINLKTAKALGLTIPPSVLARADKVIE